MIRINFVRIFSSKGGAVSIPGEMILENTFCDMTFSINLLRVKIANDINKKESEIEFIYQECSASKYHSLMLKCVIK